MRKFSIPYLSIVLSGWLVLAGSVWAQSPALVQGQVFNPDKQPISGAEVRVQNETNGDVQAGAYSDGNGTFRLRGLEAGTYTMQISAVGYDTLRQQITLLAGFNRLGSLPSASVASPQTR